MRLIYSGGVAVIHLLTVLSTEFVNMFEFERYVHSIDDKVLLSSYLSRVMLRIEACMVHYDIK